MGLLTHIVGLVRGTYLQVCAKDQMNYARKCLEQCLVLSKLTVPVGWGPCLHCAHSGGSLSSTLPHAGPWVTALGMGGCHLAALEELTVLRGRWRSVPQVQQR